MKPKMRVILEMAIEQGVRRGYARAHKHVEEPTEGAIICTNMPTNSLKLLKFPLLPFFAENHV